MNDFLKRFLCAIAFLTRLPIPSKFVFEAQDVGRATLLFPFVGAVIGLAQVVLLQLFVTLNLSINSPLKAGLVAILLVILNVFLTGALHYDGLADMADGFGGGRNKERTLEIMRDSLIGSYGATALILLILLKVTAIAALISGTNQTWQILIIAPMLGRWASVPVGKFTEYARKTGGLGKSITDFVGWTELSGATLIAVMITFTLIDWKIGLILWFVIGLISLFMVRMCLKKIGGITGDTLGANTEVCEAFVLLTAVFAAN